MLNMNNGSAFSRLFDIVDVQLQKFPKSDMLCIKEGSKWIKYSTQDVKNIVDQLSCGLLEMGIGFKDHTPEGVDKIVVISQNRPEWIMLDLAVQQVGAVLVPVYPTTNPTELNYILNESEAKLVFIGDEDILDKFDTCISEATTVKEIFSFDTTRITNWKTLLKNADEACTSKISAIKAEIQPERIATIIYTSGTTGLPKGVMLSHKNIVSNLIFDKRDLPFPDAPEWKAISFLPLNHVFERVVNYFYILSGVSIYYVTDISLIGEYLKDVRPNVFTTVPRLLEKVFEKILTTGRSLSL